MFEPTVVIGLEILRQTGDLRIIGHQRQQLVHAVQCLLGIFIERFQVAGHIAPLAAGKNVILAGGQCLIQIPVGVEPQHNGLQIDIRRLPHLLCQVRTQPIGAE